MQGESSSASQPGTEPGTPSEPSQGDAQLQTLKPTLTPSKAKFELFGVLFGPAPCCCPGHRGSCLQPSPSSRSPSTFQSGRSLASSRVHKELDPSNPMPSASPAQAAGGGLAKAGRRLPCFPAGSGTPLALMGRGMTRVSSSAAHSKRFIFLLFNSRGFLETELEAISMKPREGWKWKGRNRSGFDG